jgi:hypothetical protein
MPIAPIEGPIGPFPDHAQQRDVPVTVVGTCEYVIAAPGANPAQIDQQVRAQLLQAIRQVIGQKMHGGQLQFRDLHEQNLGPALGEIVAASGLPQMGVQIGNLSLQFGIDGRAPAPPRAMPAGPPQPAMGYPPGGYGAPPVMPMPGMQDRLVGEAKSAFKGYAIGCGILAVLLIAVAGVLVYLLKSAVDTQTASTGPGGSTIVKWDGKAPLKCGGNDNVRVEGATAKLSATAVTASDNCHLALVGVHISAPTGIDASGNAVVTVQGGSINATGLAVHASGIAQVQVSGATVSGKTQAEGISKITGI